MPQHRGDQSGDTGDDRQDDAAGDDRADERRVREPARAVAREEADERLVVVRDAVDVQQHARHEQPGEDREARDDRERQRAIPHRYVQTGWPVAGQRGQPAAERPARGRGPGRRATVAVRLASRERSSVARSGRHAICGLDRERTRVSPLPELETSPDLGRRASASRGAHDAFPRRPLSQRSSPASRRSSPLGWYARSPATPARPGEGGRARRRRGGTPASRPARVPRPPARPLCGDRAAADARARDHARRGAPARRARSPRPPRRGDPARRQLRRGLGLRPPKRHLDERAAGVSRTSATSGIVVGLALVLVVVELVRRRSRWSFLFLLTVLAGMEISMLAVKDLVGRLRPTLNPAAATLGPSFPSGHSATAAAFYAAAALVIGRRLRGRVRHLIAAIAVAHRCRSRGEPRAARPALALRRRRRPRTRLGVVRALRSRLRRPLAHADRRGRHRGR